LIADGLPQYRLDWQTALGIPDPQNADDMFDLFVAMTTKDPNKSGKNDTWVYGAMSEWDNSTALSMFGVPNKWRKNDDGTFTKHIESEEYKAAIAWLIRCREAGVFHPNAVSNGFAQSQELFNNGQLAVFGGSLLGVTWQTPVNGVTNWNKQIWSLFPVGHDGGAVQLWQSPATFGFFAIPAKLKSDEAKIRELLGVLNYWAAPFGSAEYTFMNFGIEGHNFERKDGAPVLSENSARHGELAAAYVPSPAQQNIFAPGQDALALKIQQGFEKVTPDSIADPSLNLVSQTQISVGAQLQQMEKDIYTDLVSGRQSVDALPAMIDKWRRAGGDQVRSELEKAAK
jgi:putative aldouronate transport system substrate-binding protein